MRNRHQTPTPLGVPLFPLDANYRLVPSCFPAVTKHPRMSAPASLDTQVPSGEPTGGHPKVTASPNTHGSRLKSRLILPGVTASSNSHARHQTPTPLAVTKHPHQAAGCRQGMEMLGRLQRPSRALGSGEVREEGSKRRSGALEAGKRSGTCSAVTLFLETEKSTEPEMEIGWALEKRPHPLVWSRQKLKISTGMTTGLTTGGRAELRPDALKTLASEATLASARVIKYPRSRHQTPPPPSSNAHAFPLGTRVKLRVFGDGTSKSGRGLACVTKYPRFRYQAGRIGVTKYPHRARQDGLRRAKRPVGRGHLVTPLDYG